MKKTKRRQAQATDRAGEVARVRGEVWAALRRQDPSEPQLMAALERVDQLLAAARAELADTARELHALLQLEPSGQRPVPAAGVAPLRGWPLPF